MTDISANVKAILPVITPFTISDSDFDMLWPIVDEEYQQYVGSNIISDNTRIQAEMFLMAHYLSAQAGQVGLKSESLGRYSYSTADKTGMRWYRMFEMAVRAGINGAIHNARDFSTGHNHYDIASSETLQLDQNSINDMVDEDYEPV